MNTSKGYMTREILETLVVQNFKDAWEECLTELIRECMETGDFGSECTEEWFRAQDWTDAKAEFLQNYIMDLGTLITQQSGLFNA